MVRTQSTGVKMKIVQTFIIGWFIGILTQSYARDARFPSSNQVLTRLAVGSCLKQNQDLSVLEAVISTGADMFVFAGDNIYADTTDENLLRKA